MPTMHRDRPGDLELEMASASRLIDAASLVQGICYRGDKDDRARVVAEAERITLQAWCVLRQLRSYFEDPSTR